MVKAGKYYLGRESPTCLSISGCAGHCLTVNLQRRSAGVSVVLYLCPPGYPCGGTLPSSKFKLRTVTTKLDIHCFFLGNVYRCSNQQASLCSPYIQYTNATHEELRPRKNTLTHALRMQVVWDSLHYLVPLVSSGGGLSLIPQGW